VGPDGAAEVSFEFCEEGDTVVAEVCVCSEGTGGLSDVAEGTLRSCPEGRSVEVDTGSLSGTAERSL
jgi:hypothetical protein